MAKQYYFNDDFQQRFCAKCGQQFFGPLSQKHCSEHRTIGEPARCRPEAGDRILPSLRH